MSKHTYNRSKKFVRGQGATLSSLSNLTEAVVTDIGEMLSNEDKSIILSNDLSTILRSAFFGFVVGGMAVASSIKLKTWFSKFKKDSEFGNEIIKQLQDMDALKLRVRKINKDNEMFMLFMSGNLLKEVEFKEEDKTKEDFTWLDIADVEGDQYVLVFKLLENLSNLKDKLESENGFTDAVTLELIYDLMERSEYYTEKDTLMLVSHLTKKIQSMNNIYKSLTNGISLTWQQRQMLQKRLEASLSIFTPEVLESMPPNFVLFEQIMETIPIVEKYVIQQYGGSLQRTASVNRIRRSMSGLSEVKE